MPLKVCRKHHLLLPRGLSLPNPRWLHNWPVRRAISVQRISAADALGPELATLHPVDVVPSTGRTGAIVCILVLAHSFVGCRSTIHVSWCIGRLHATGPISIDTGCSIGKTPASITDRIVNTARVRSAWRGLLSGRPLRLTTCSSSRSHSSRAVLMRG